MQKKLNPDEKMQILFRKLIKNLNFLLQTGLKCLILLYPEKKNEKMVLNIQQCYALVEEE
jgi:hypothetical protein